MLVLFVFLVVFPIVYPEKSPSCIWERAAGTVYHLSHLFTNTNSCCDFIPLDLLWAESGIRLYQFLIVALFNCFYLRFMGEGAQPKSFIMISGILCVC